MALPIIFGICCPEGLQKRCSHTQVAFAHVFKYARLFEVWVTTYNQGECMRFQQHFGSGGSLLCHL